MEGLGIYSAGASLPMRERGLKPFSVLKKPSSLHTMPKSVNNEDPVAPLIPNNMSRMKTPRSFCSGMGKKKRPFSEASTQRYYRWGGYIMVSSIKTWFKSQVVIDNPKGLIPCHFSKVAWLFPASLK
jgi:hypothetical protein